MSYSQDLLQLHNPKLEDLIRIAYNNLPDDKRTHPWIGLSHGVKLLGNENELMQYLCAYGKMHKEKIVSALDAIREPRNSFSRKITIIDWGCGQGLASICFLDYVRELGIVPNIEKVVLIEPSVPAINRANEHLHKYIGEDQILLVNKYINDVTNDEIATNSNLVLHFFSNILDIPSVDIDHIANIVKEGIHTEQLFFCVGPQNIGASRISDFAKLFKIEEDGLLKKYTGNLQGRGTINLLVFRVESEITEVVKVEFRHARHLRVSTHTSIQRVLTNAKVDGDCYDKAFQFYRSIIEFERIKSVSAGDAYAYPIHIEESGELSKLNIDIQENANFESLFKRNLDHKLVKWPQNLNIGIGVIVDGRLYQLLQYIYPHEDIKNIDIAKQYISVCLSSFNLNTDVASDLQIGEDQVDAIESTISDTTTTWECLENLLKDAINNDVVLDKYVYLSLSSTNPALSQINAELKQLAPKKDGTLLTPFLCGHIEKNIISNPIDEETLLRVVKADKSQLEAIAYALNNKVSVVTGPPGSGKTQMILNLIANAYMQGKSVLVASKNNEAVNNIKDRYDLVDASKYLLRFGSKDAVTSQLLPYLERLQASVSQLEIDTHRYSDLCDQYKISCDSIKQNKKMLLELAMLEDEIQLLPCEIQAKELDLIGIQSENKEIQKALQVKHDNVLNLSYCGYNWSRELNNVRGQINILQSKYSGLGKLFFNWFSKKRYAASCLNALLQMPNEYSLMIERQSQISCVDDVKNGQDLLYLYATQKAVIEKIIECSTDFANQEQSYKAKLNACESEIARLKKRQVACKERIDLLLSRYEDIQEALRIGQKYIEDTSVELFTMSVLYRLCQRNTDTIISRYKNYLPDSIPWKMEEQQTYLNDAKSFLNLFRLNAVTNLSIKNCYPLQDGFFDMVIIDEASQCDVASALPLIYRAKQLVVIGDPLQLKHISAVNADEEMAIKNYLSFDENPLVRYADYSLWDYCRDLITTSKENHKPIVLDCHYRCHPQIIGYSNQMFYEKGLGVTLDVRTTEKNPMLKQKGIIWMDVRGEQRSDAQNINDAEVEKCISIATHLAKQYPEISIGIISPFKHQAQEINAHIPVNLSDRIVADTVHKFQGGERDVIIYSLVVTNNSPATKIRWIDRSVPNLVNVAVTRARTALYIVGNKEYIRAYSNIDLPLGNLVEYTEAKGLAPSIDPGNTFIIDTNIFVQCPDVIDAINPRDNIVIPAKVIDELDKLKVSLSSESLRDNAEKALRNINRELNKRKIREECGDLSCLPQDFSRKNADNLILSIALKFRNHSPILLTNDNGLQVKAKGLGVDTMTLRELVGY